MCVSCGCGDLQDKHDDERHITLDDLEKAANAANTSVAEVAKNIKEGVSKSAEAAQADGS